MMPSPSRNVLLLFLFVALFALSFTACKRQEASKKQPEAVKKRLEIKRAVPDFAKSPPDLVKRSEEQETRLHHKIDYGIGTISRTIETAGGFSNIGDWYRRRGALYFQKGEHAKAASDLERGIKLLEEKRREDEQKKDFAGYDFDFEGRLLDAYKLLGTCYYAQGSYAKAKEMFSHVIEKRPEDWEGYDYMGLLLESEGDYKSAIGYYSKGIEKAKHVKLHYDRGGAYANQGDLDRALADFVEAKQGSSPFEVQAQFREAQVLEAKGKKSEALAAYRTVVNLITPGIETKGDPATTVPKPDILVEAQRKIEELEKK